MRDEYEVEKVEKDGLRLTISYDHDCPNPRDNDGNMVHLICFHRRYTLGDKHDYREGDFDSWNELEAQLRKDFDIVHIQPLYMYDHSGISISTSHGYPYNDQWDVGMIGFAFIDKATIRENYGIRRVTKKQIARAMKEFESEIETYDQYVQGECFGYTVEKVGKCECCGQEEDEHVDSCWGFIGRDWKTNGLMDNLPQEYRALVEAL